MEILITSWVIIATVATLLDWRERKRRAAALGDLLPEHPMECVSGLDIHAKPWAFDATADGRPLVTRESCRCTGEVRSLRAMLPEGHPKGFVKNAESIHPESKPTDHE